MDHKTYREAFDQIPFSAGFQERTADLLRRRARELEKENKIVKFSKTKKLAVTIAAAVALLVVSVSAALVWLTPSQVAELHGQDLLAEAFEGPDAIGINETVETGDFAVTLMGLVSGEDLDTMNPDPGNARTYAVLSVRRLDGEPLETETFRLTDYTMTPLAAGFSPAAVNSWTLGAFASGFAENGVYYYLLETDSIEKFADHTVYMAFYEGFAPNNTIFTVKDDGAIAFCDDFTGVQALFTLPLDSAKADAAAVDAFLEEHSTGWTNAHGGEEPWEVLNARLEPVSFEEEPEDPYAATPEEIAAGTPYTPEEAERHLLERNERMEQCYAKGAMSQEDYDLWTREFGPWLEGVRNGTIRMVELEEGRTYSYDVSGEDVN